MDHYILMSEIRSLKQAQDPDFQRDLKNVTAIINKLHKKDLITPLDIVIPGEFQGITNDLQGSLQMIFDIEECIIENNLNFKLKHVLYHDTIETVQSKHSAYERLGFGLIDARDKLNQIKKTDSRFLMVTSNEKQSLDLNNLFFIYEDYIDSWKKTDYEYVSAFMNNKDYKEVASQFNLNISSGWRREKSLKMKQYYTIKEMILGVAG
ncbi:MAG: SatD family protein [Bacteroidota bacterium]